MGQIFVVKSTKRGIYQVPIEKYTMLGGTVDLKPEQVKKIGDSLGIDWNSTSLTELYEGTKVESKEHVDIIGSDIEKAVKIAFAHLKEISDYYTRLKAMEASAKPNPPNTDNNIQNASGGTEKISKGGAGSGRYPAGSGKEKEAPMGRTLERVPMKQAILEGLAQAHDEAVTRGTKKAKDFERANDEATNLKIPDRALQGILHMKGNGYTNNDVMRRLDQHIQTKAWAGKLKDRTHIKDFLDRHF